MKKFLFFIISIIFFSCSHKQESSHSTQPIFQEPQIIPLNTDEGYAVNRITGDSVKTIRNSVGKILVTGKKIKTNGKIVSTDSLSKPLTQKAGNFLNVPFVTNIVPAKNNEEMGTIGLVEFTPTAESEQFILKNSTGKILPTNKKIPIKGKVVPCRFPKPIPVAAPLMKDKATHNIQFLDVDQGMSSSYIYTILRDKNGYLWFDSWGGGASRYDGKYLTNFTTSEGLSNNNVYTILEDDKGNLWFGTYGGGINCYDGEKFIQFTEHEGLSHDRIWSLLQDSKGNIWIGTDGGGVSRYDGKTITHYTTKEGLAHNIVYTLFEDKDGNIWMGTQGGGASKFNGKTFSNFTIEQGLNDNNVWAIFQDKSGAMWFGTNDGVCKLQNNKISYLREENGLGNNMVYSIRQNKNGEMLFGTYGGGLSIYHHDQFETYSVKEGLSNDYVRFIYLDESGSIWLSTDGGGVNIVKRESFRHSTVNEGLVDNYVNVLMEDSKKNLWMGTYGGICVYDGENLNYITEDFGLKNNYVRTILEDNEGDFWIGADAGGICKLNMKDNLQGDYFTYYGTKEGMSHEIIYSLVQDKQGKIWIGTYGGGLNSFDGKSFTHYTDEHGLSNNFIYHVIEDRKGNLWLATWGGGVSKFDGESFINYSEKEGLSNNYVNTLLEDSDGKIWMGTNYGLNLFDGESFYCFTKKQGLCDNVIYSLKQDSNGGIWVTTEKGVSYLIQNEETKNYEVKLVYTKPDGLKGIDFIANSVALDHENKIWWGSGKSLERMDLNNFKISKAVPKVNLTQVLINENYIDFRNLPDTLKEAIQIEDVEPFENFPDEITLTYDKNHLSFQYTAIDWSSPGKIKYQYKLEGLDREWNPVTENTIADYRNIPYGTYTFKVRAIGESQIWSEPFEYSFTILPPWWHTVWFRVVLSIVILVILFLIYQWRTAALRKRQRQLEQTVEIRTTEVRHQKELIEEKQKEIIDSINYAKRLQQAILTPKEEIDKFLPNSFLLYKPKDIVAGDFYFFETTNDYIFYAAADCTGHGVPGAMLSIVCSNALSRSVKEFDLVESGKILDKTRELILETFEKSKQDVKDGMDISFITINRVNKEIHWSGANNPLWILEANEMRFIKPDKQPIGKSDQPKPFSTHFVELKEEAILYLFTDGYADQFGGANGKKFKYANLQKLLIDNAHLEMNIQAQILNAKFEEWRSDLEQVDDVCIIGIKL